MINPPPPQGPPTAPFTRPLPAQLPPSAFAADPVPAPVRSKIPTWVWVVLGVVILLSAVGGFAAALGEQFGSAAGLGSVLDPTVHVYVEPGA
ncbi:hypothetical protein ACWEKT_02540 [Nocardia takedensis]